MLIQMFLRISTLIVRDVRLNRFDGNVKILIEMIVISVTIFHGLRKNLNKSSVTIFLIQRLWIVFLLPTKIFFRLWSKMLKFLDCL